MSFGCKLTVFMCIVVMLQIQITDAGCSTSEMSCANGICVNVKFWCDGSKDCSDGSDEIGSIPGGCRTDEFCCGQGYSIPKYWKCDGENDCPNGQDEVNCPILVEEGPTALVLTAYVLCGVLVSLIILVIVVTIHAKLRLVNNPSKLPDYYSDDSLPEKIDV